MSKIALEGNASGTGTFTIAAPNSNSNYTLTLPTSSGTVVTTGGAQTIEFAAGSAAAPSITTTGDTNTGIFFPAADTIAFAEGGVEAMRIDSSGNLGLGVTPSAWLAGVRALEINSKGNAFVSSSASQSLITTNAYFDGSFKYGSTAAASYYSQNSGVHSWYTAPSGTAGNAITFTQVLAVEKDKSLALQGATSQSGTGITFPATQSASSDANTLDDYEEGTWTPAVSFGGGTTGITYSRQEGYYTKVGRQVTVTCHILLSNKGSSSGQLTITGLPFTLQDTPNDGAVAAVVPSNFTGLTEQVSLVGVNNTTTAAYYKGFNTANNLTNTDCTNTTNPLFTMTYFV